MDYDRRSLLSVLALSGLLPGCARAAPPLSSWEAFSQRFLSPDGRIVDTGNNGISHTEGQGYGMILAEAVGDRQAFDRIWRWTDKMLARSDARLFSWRFDPAAAKPVGDPNNATDGDIFIAWALYRAASRWPGSDYAMQSSAIRTAIRERLVRIVGNRTVLLPGLEGFATSERTTLNPSYYVWPAFQAFQQVDGAKAWDALVKDGARLIDEARFGAASLAPDWIDLSNDGTVSLAKGHAPRFGFDAIRVPLFLAWTKRRDALQPYKAFWGGYLDQGKPVPAWIDLSNGQTAEYPLSEGGMAVVDVTTGRKPRQAGGDYYSSALGALAGLVS